jgi:serine/threonine-protein kinase
MPIAAGERIGPYQILAPLGAGGMGEVYAATDTRLRRRVAIKRLTGPATRAAELRRRALNEARAAAQLNHPHIAAVYDVLETDEALLIVMEYVEGQTLAARLQQGRLPLGESVRIVTAIADGLAAAHRVGVLHRDLKPSNVVLMPDGQVKILDFGLARITEAPTDHVTGDLTPTATAIGQLAGTPAYMSPERITGRTVDHRADIYSLGVLLFELLTGRLPFIAPDFISLLTQIATQPAPAPQRIDPAIPTAISQVVTRAMAMDPADRYATAEEFAEDLRKRAAAAAGVEQPLALTRRSSRWIAIVLAVALLLGAGGGALISWRFSQRRPAPASAAAAITVAVVPLTNNTGDSRSDYLGVGTSYVLAAGLFPLPGVNVVSCTTTTDCGGSTTDVRTVAERLDATLVVDGVVQPHAEGLKVTLRLTEMPAGAVKWTAEYTTSVVGLFDTQRRMTADLASALGHDTPAGAGSAEAQLARGAGTSNLVAFEQYAQARLLLERTDIPGHTTRAIDLLESAVDQDSQFALAYAALGQACWLRYEETRDRSWTERATSAILEALRLDGSQPQVRLSLATIYLGSGELQKAEAEARIAVERQPQSDEAHRVLASILIEQGRAEEAMSEANVALQLRPRFWRNVNQIGYIHYREGRFEQAVAAYRQSIDLQPDNAQAYHMLGAVYLAMGQPDEARRALGRGNEIQPDAVSLSNLGTVHYWAGRYDAAAAAYERAVQLRPREPLYHRNLGDALQRLGARRRAREAYTRAVRATEELLVVSPGNVNNRAMLAVYLAKIGDHARARDEIARALQTGSESEEVWYRKAVVHALAGDAAAALDALDRALRQGASRAVAAQDEDLAALRKHPRFKALVAADATKGG